MARKGTRKKHKKKRGKKLNEQKLFRHKQPVEPYDMRQGREPAIARFLHAKKLFKSWVHKISDPTHKRDAQNITALLKEARIVVIPTELAAEFFIMLAESVEARLRDAIEDVKGEAPPDTIGPLAYRNQLDTDSKRVVDQQFGGPYPKRLPFPVTYLAYDIPVPYHRKPSHPTDEFLEMVYTDALKAANMRGPIRFVGYVLSLDRCYSIVHGRYLGDENARVIVPVLEYDETRWQDGSHLRKGFWYYPHSTMTQMVPMFIDWIFDHKTVLDTPFNTPPVPKPPTPDMAIEQPIPNPYYVVHMDDVVKVQQWQQKRQRAGRIRRSPAHKYDVREHDRIRVLRGPLPLEADVRAKLEKPRKGAGRGYYIFTETQPGGDLGAMLFKRGVARKRPDEWLAVLVTPIKHHIKGPVDGPYVPSVRVSRRHMNQTGGSHV